MPERVTAYIALGSNLDGPRVQVERAFDALARLPETRLRARSRVYRTPPWGIVEQPDFINAAAAIETALAPHALLSALHAIESGAHRVRGVRNGPRTLDLDLLMYGAVRLDDPDLVLPHPRLHERAFVLLPLADIASAVDVPGRGRVSALLAAVDTRGCVPLD
ncbi:MAG TPA: 2-amino-4-hydroxy-6-hydroxymethyldihydropteridine diphosphokinase [Rhodanobacteraceae bacterium]